MPKPYSADLRERVLLADEAGLPPAAIAQRFGVGLATVYLWRQQAHARGRRCAKPHGGGRGDLAGAGGRTQRSHAGRIPGAVGGGPPVSRPTLCRALRRLGLRRKKDAAR